MGHGMIKGAVKKAQQSPWIPSIWKPTGLIYHTAKKNYLILKKGYSKHTGRNTALFADY
jgi:hypothetical protein